jgi:homoserine acetyltransferase
VITLADMVEVERRLTDALGIERWALMVGTTAAVGADQIGSHEAQIEAIRADLRFRGGDC